MIYQCKVCKQKEVTRKSIRAHIKKEHPGVFRELADAKRARRKSHGTHWRHEAPLSDKYEVLK